MNTEKKAEALDLRDRLNAITIWAVPGRGRFRELSEMSGISQESWKATWHSRQRPTSEMVQFVARTWPECAFWLATGITDQRHGHRAPSEINTYPEPSYTPRTGASKYFRQQVEMLDRQEADQPELYEHTLQLRALEASRDLDQVSCEQEDALQEEKFVAGFVQNLEAEPTTEPISRTARFVGALQADRQFNDSEMASLLGKKVEDLEKLKSGGGLDARATARVFDSWAYDRIRDALLRVLPDDKAQELRRRDIERGRRRLLRRDNPT